MIDTNLRASLILTVQDFFKNYTIEIDSSDELKIAVPLNTFKSYKDEDKLIFDLSQNFIVFFQIDEWLSGYLDCFYEFIINRDRFHEIVQWAYDRVRLQNFIPNKIDDLLIPGHVF